MTITATRGKWRSGPRAWVIAGFLLPATVLFTVLLIYPMATALSYSLFEWKGTARGAFVGLGNFAELFTDDRFRGLMVRAFSHNVVFCVATLVVQNTLGLWLAVQLHKSRSRRVLRVLFTTPYLVSPLVVGYLWSLMLSPTSGALNSLLTTVGLDFLALPWMGDPNLALPTVVVVIIWQWVGFPILLYSAAIAGLPSELEDAARVDGASEWQRFRSITFPLLAPAIGTVGVLTFIFTMETFPLVYALGGSTGAPAGSTDVLGLIFYRTAFQSGSINALGRSSAFAIVLFVLIFGGATIANKVLRKREESLS